MDSLDDEFARVLARECGGEPQDYNVDLSDLPDLDEAAALGEIDMSRDEWVDSVQSDLDIDL